LFGSFVTLRIAINLDFDFDGFWFSFHLCRLLLLLSLWLFLFVALCMLLDDLILFNIWCWLLWLGILGLWKSIVILSGIESCIQSGIDGGISGLR